jgi:hypothetical protein
VGSRHVHSSRLIPVGFAGFLIKYLHVHWHDLGFRPGPPPCRFAWPFSRRLGPFPPVVCYPLCSLRRSVKFSLRRSVNFYVFRPATVRYGHFAVWAISARGVPAPVFNRLFLSASRWLLSLGRCGPPLSPKNKFYRLGLCLAHFSV